MVRLPYLTGGTVPKRLPALNERAVTIKWVYMVTFGEKYT